MPDVAPAVVREAPVDAIARAAPAVTLPGDGTGPVPAVPSGSRAPLVPRTAGGGSPSSVLGAGVALLGHAALVTVSLLTPFPPVRSGLQEGIPVEIVVEAASAPARDIAAPTPPPLEVPPAPLEALPAPVEAPSAPVAAPKVAPATTMPQRSPSVAAMASAPAAPPLRAPIVPERRRTAMVAAPPAPAAAELRAARERERRRDLARVAAEQAAHALAENRVEARRAAREARLEAGNAAPAVPLDEAPTADTAAEVAGYSQRVTQRIASLKHYPDEARARGARGTALVSFTLDGAGDVRSAVIASSSGDAGLDAEAVATVRRAGSFGPPPRGSPRGFTVPLRYIMR